MEFLRQCFPCLPEIPTDAVAAVGGMHPAPTQDTYQPVLIDAETGEAYALPADFGDEPVPIVERKVDADTGIVPRL